MSLNKPLTVDATLAALIVSLITIFNPIKNTFFPPLEATVETLTSPVAPDLERMLGILQNVYTGHLHNQFYEILKKSLNVRLGESDRITIVQQLISKVSGYFTKDRPESRSIIEQRANADFADILGQYIPNNTVDASSVAEQLVKIIQNDLPSYRDFETIQSNNTVTHITIKINAAVCPDVRVHVPYANMFFVPNTTQKQSGSEPSEDLKLGDLQSGDTVEVFAWGGRFALLPGELRVTSNEGPAKLTIPQGNWLLFHPWIGYAPAVARLSFSLCAVHHTVNPGPQEI